MLPTLWLIVFVNRADASDATTDALRRAATQVLGPSAQIDVRPYDAPPSEAELAAASAARAAVAEIVWQDPSHHHATLLCYLGQEGRSITREVTFSDFDAPTERGRMLGFALASLVPDASESQAAPKASASAAAPVTPSATAPVAPSAAAPSVPRLQLAPTHYYGAVDAVAEGATGAGGGFGAGVGGRWFFHPQLGLRLGFAVRRGEISEARAFSDAKSVALGLTFRYSGASDTPWSFGGRADLLLTAHEIGRFPAAGGPPARSTRWVAGADLLFEAAWNATASAAVLANLGVEASFSDDALLHGQDLAELPIFRGVAELGARARF